MKKIVLFSRNDLTNLYGGMSKHLEEAFGIIHVAYSDGDEEILKNEYGIRHVVNFKKEISRLLENEKPDRKLLDHIDTLIIKHTNNRFCLNSSIQSDRTFARITYDEALILAQAYYKFWNNLMTEHHFQFLLHEPVALFFLQVAAVVCSENQAKYLTQIQVFGEKDFNWIFVSAEDGCAVEMADRLKSNALPDEGSRKRAADYIRDFRENYLLLLPEIASKNRPVYRSSPFGLVSRMARSVYRHLKLKITTAKRTFDFKDHVEKYAFYSRPKLSDKLKNQWDEYFHMKYDAFDPEKEYYYYPMHTEPEAVVLYWGDGIYKNQVKLIENIAAQVPPGCYLYVKYHPVKKDDRDYLDYKRIKAIPNVRLIGQETPGKRIIAGCRGLFTINGTSGFEAILLNKPVFVFGNSFYDLSDRVIKVKNIRDLRQVVYDYRDRNFTDDDALYRFVFSFLDMSKQGYTAYYSNYKEILKIDHPGNVKTVAKGIINFLA